MMWRLTNSELTNKVNLDKINKNEYITGVNLYLSGPRGERKLNPIMTIKNAQVKFAIN